MPLGLLVLAIYISCIFDVVCASFSVLATRKLAGAKADSSGIWALGYLLKEVSVSSIWKGRISPNLDYLSMYLNQLGGATA